MEAWDDDPQVRPIPIEDVDDVLLPPAGRRHRRGQRPWLPLVISGAAVVGLIGAVALLGAVEFQDAPATNPEVFSPTTLEDADAPTTEALPPTLEEAIPGTTDRLTLTTTDGDALWTLVWDPSFRVPKPYGLMTPQETFWSSAAFDTGGRFIAARGTGTPEDGPTDVWIGTPSDIDYAPKLQDVLSLAWHASEVSRLAFVTLTYDPDSETAFALWTTEIDAMTNSPTEPTPVTEFDELVNIVRWDSNGFVLQAGDRTLALDPTGKEVWSVDGRAYSASPNFIPHVRQTSQGSQWNLLDRATGDRMSLTNFGIVATAEATDIIAAQSNDLFAVATYREARTTITIFGSERSSRRIVQLEGDPTLYQFTRDAAYLILRLSGANDLIFLDWRSGAAHRFDVPGDHEVLAVNLG